MLVYLMTSKSYRIWEIVGKLADIIGKTHTIPNYYTRIYSNIEFRSTQSQRISNSKALSILWWCAASPTAFPLSYRHWDKKRAFILININLKTMVYNNSKEIFPEVKVKRLSLFIFHHRTDIWLKAFIMMNFQVWWEIGKTQLSSTSSHTNMNLQNN